MEKGVKTWSAVPAGAQHVSQPPPPKKIRAARTCLVSEDPKYEENPNEFDVNFNHETDDSIMVVYEDKYVRITDKYLIIKKYFFPGRESKIIALSNIQKIRFLGPMFSAPKWGIDTDRNTWWAHDFMRNEQRENPNVCGLMFDVGEKVLKGTTVNNFERVLEIIQCERHDIEY
ncbi:unnamed protein product [Caenorhabditis angaria]|uniref:Uncharacterized protein n=1 Tax=Caenorhabditis angaria TaxID=860376 RepID=A0A9P1J6R3_9PELO|nr:unnamed protein product [Caenorhabditis angaria]